MKTIVNILLLSLCLINSNVSSMETALETLTIITPMTGCALVGYNTAQGDLRTATIIAISTIAAPLSMIPYLRSTPNKGFAIACATTLTLGTIAGVINQYNSIISPYQQ